MTSIRTWIQLWNDNPKPFVWHKTADEILDNLAANCSRINDPDRWLKLQNLRPEHLDTLYAALLEEGLAPKMVRNIHTMLHKGLKDAMRKNLVVRNVADAADPPRVTRGDDDLQTWTGEQLRRFLEAMAEHRLYAPFLLGATTGMRRGAPTARSCIQTSTARRSAERSGGSASRTSAFTTSGTRTPPSASRQEFR